MNKQTHNISLLAPCGLYCAVCPKFIGNKCEGCNSNLGIAERHRKYCGIFKCCGIQGIQRCSECKLFPDCDGLKNFISFDSFISHAPAIDNLKSLREMGEEPFIRYMHEKIQNKEYPPAIRRGTLSLRKLIKWTRVPIKRMKV